MQQINLKKAGLVWAGFKIGAAVIISGVTSVSAASEALEQATNNPELAATLKMINAHGPLRVPEVSDPGSVGNRRVLDAMVQKLLLSPPRPVPSTSLDSPTAAPLVGTLETDFSVDNRGTGEYTVWLSIPESRSSLAPSPAVTYYSNNGKSALGWRFAFSTGFHHAIRRGRSILARDDETRGIEFSASDKFYLDGKRLLCISSPDTHGKPGSRYRTEVDSFSRITANGEGDEITGFTVVNRHGRTYFFGKLNDSTDGYQPACDPDTGELTPLAYDYALKRVEDTLGNWVEFNYKHFGEGEWSLTHISYTGGPDIDPLYHIRLSYKASGPEIPKYFSMRRSDARMILDSIVVLADFDAVPVAQYQFAYDDITGNRNQRLQSITGGLAPEIGALTQALPPIRFQWSPRESEFTPGVGATPQTLAPLPGSVGTVVRTGDFNGDGKRDVLRFRDFLTVTLSDQNGFGPQSDSWLPKESIHPLSSESQIEDVQIGDFDGDDKDDVVLIGANGRLLTAYSDGQRFSVGEEIDASAYFEWADNDISPSSRKAAPIVSSRVNLGDMTGDARDDLVIYDSNGQLHCFPSLGDAFSSTAFSLDTRSVLSSDQTLRSEIVDMNGDGNADFVWIDDSRSSSLKLQCVLMLPEGELAKPFTLHEWPVGPTALVMGDFNGDDLPDMLIGSAATGAEEPWEWTTVLNRGMTTSKSPTGKAPITTITNVVTEGTALLVPPPSPAANPTVTGKPSNPLSPLRVGVDVDHGLQMMAIDTNADGLDDLVFYRPSVTLPAKGSAGSWWTSHSLGNGLFDTPERLTSAPWIHLHPLTSSPPFAYLAATRWVDVHPYYDITGDGRSDWVSLLEGSASDSSILAFPSGTDQDPDNSEFSDLVTHFSDGYGRTMAVAYKAAKDDVIYTPGVPIPYPIRELRSSTPIVSDVWHDIGGKSHSHFSYFYAANRIDFSGRGTLGFGAFMTLDRTTGFFKYQQLEHAFPLTGMESREETYRSWLSDDKAFVKLLESTDYANVFDLVRDPFSDKLFGTLFSQTARETISEWLYNRTPTYELQRDLLDSSLTSRAWLPQTPPRKPEIINITSYWFDKQSQRDPPNTEYPTVSLPWVLAASVPEPESAKEVDFAGDITYGNERLNYLDYREGFFSRESTFYHEPESPDTPMTGRVARRTSAEYINSDGTIYAPIESFEYFNQTGLLESSRVDSRGATNAENPGTVDTLFERDDRGRLLTKRIIKDPPDPPIPSESEEETEPDNRVYVAEDFDDYIDLPFFEWDLEDGNRTMRYNALLRRATEIDYHPGGRVRLQYDELDRLIRAENLDSDYLRTIQYEWTNPTAQNWQRTQTVADPTGGKGITGTSVYAVRVEKVGDPTTTSYYDRLQRLIRLRTDYADGRVTFEDTVYNELESEAAESEPYEAAGRVKWKVHRYDEYGRQTNSGFLTRDAPAKPSF
ncbi:MAG: hypothetical protein SynsKO_29550 [Synoicihabitans sp.]